jgi:excisionase family DNA binding protein
MLGIGKTTFYELVEAGEIDAIKIGRVTVVTVSSLQAFVARCLDRRHAR